LAHHLEDEIDIELDDNHKTINKFIEYYENIYSNLG